MLSFTQHNVLAWPSAETIKIVSALGLRQGTVLVMLRPVGVRPASVYWRRRLLVFVVFLALVVMTIVILRSPGGTHPVANPSNTASSGPASQAGASPAATDTAAKTSSSTAPKCSKSQLVIKADAGAPKYLLSAKPDLALMVTNKGPAPCQTSLSDGAIELVVRNGSARIWGSHDCQVQPGNDLQTLEVNQPVRRGIQWSGYSAVPGCSLPRQHVGVGTYTVYPSLSGQPGTTAQFEFTNG